MRCVKIAAGMRLSAVITRKLRRAIGLRLTVTENAPVSVSSVLRPKDRRVQPILRLTLFSATKGRVSPLRMHGHKI